MPEVRRADKELLVGGASEQAASCLHDFNWIIFDSADELGSRKMHRIHDHIGEEEKVPPVLLDLNGALARRVPRRRAKPDARQQLTPILDQLEDSALSEWLNLLDEKQRRLWALRPIVVLHAGHRMTCVHTGWPKRSHRSAHMIGMPVRQDDEINILNRRSSHRQRIDQATARSSEIPAGAGVDESEPTVRTNDEDIARVHQLSPLIEHPSELACKLRRINGCRNVETRRHREASRTAELPHHGARRTHHAARV